MIICIRGTHGSGKSALMYELLRKGNGDPLFGLFGGKRPEAYALSLEAVDRPVYVLGPYVTICGGCDAVQPYAEVINLINKYAPLGHVLLEGALISCSFGSVGEAMARYPGSVMAFMSTPLEICLDRVEARRKARAESKPFNPKNTIQKHKAVRNSRRQIARAGMRAVNLSVEDPLTDVLNLLRGQ